jgi:hypothetical protein
VRSILRHIASFAILCAVLAAAVTGDAKDPKKISARIGPDSTTFILSIPPHKVFRVGQKFSAKIHVDLRNGWHIRSGTCDGSDCKCLIPLTILVPDSLSRYFEIVALKEGGKIISWDDSNLGAMSAHFDPYDIIATLRVKSVVEASAPFHLFVGYGASNEKWCLPTRWFDVQPSARRQDLVTKI